MWNWSTSPCPCNPEDWSTRGTGATSTPYPFRPLAGRVPRPVLLPPCRSHRPVVLDRTHQTLQALIACPPMYHLMKSIPIFGETQRPCTSTPMMDNLWVVVSARVRLGRRVRPRGLRTKGVLVFSRRVYSIRRTRGRVLIFFLNDAFSVNVSSPDRKRRVKGNRKLEFDSFRRVTR